MRGRARFLLVQVAEAHATDEWPVGLPHSRLQLRSDEERVQAAGALRRAMGLSDDLALTAADTHAEHFDRAFGAWPTSMWVLDGASGRVLFVAQPSERAAFDVQPLRDALDRALADAVSEPAGP